MAANWREVLKSQYADLERLELMDQELNEQAVHANIDKVLKKPVSLRVSSSTKPAAQVHYDESEPSPQARNIPQPVPPPRAYDGLESTSSLPSYTEFADDVHLPAPLNAHDDIEERVRPVDSPDSHIPKAPETQARYMKAKVKMLEQQLAGITEQKKQASDQVLELQRQLKIEKEDKKLLKQRIQILESDTRKQGKKASETVEDQSEQLLQEIAQLKKDLQTAERIGKQNDQNMKTKDTQLKRSVETITKLKAQLAEIQQAQSQSNSQVSTTVDRSTLEAAENKIKVLEKQKADLLAAFKKQMRLIDVLKRQKAHLEAARLLAFSEEEFMKALDWNA